MPKEAISGIVGDLAEGEREVVMLIALTENLVTLTGKLAGTEVGTLLEHMIRQLGESAVAGASEHYKLTQEQFTPLVVKAHQVIEATQKAAMAASEEQHASTQH
jgi:hypothetical protein